MTRPSSQITETSRDPRFAELFKALTGFEPFPWQGRLFDKFVGEDIPKACDLPTGLGKTSVVAVWLVTKLLHREKVPTRLVCSSNS